MTAILAIDAAWTATEPSGVALVCSDGTGWRCVTAAPSYDAFIAVATGNNIPWSQASFPGAAPDVPNLLSAAHQLAGSPVDLITIDMPVATVPITSRRAADNAISAEFGSRWCSTHNPNPSRPGPLGSTLTKALKVAGFPLATCSPRDVRTPCMLEVYPHPALLSLLNRPRRVPYKVGKSISYWPTLTLKERIEKLHTEFVAIHKKLTVCFGPLNVPLPEPLNVQTLASLKRYEDTLDALVCAWVGVQFLEGRTVALGDDTAAIWCPRDVVLQKPNKSD